jgi:hypothetical protein
MPLQIRNIDVLPAEEPGIDGPSARSDHCQSGTECRQHNRNPWVTGVRESNSQLKNGQESSRDWGP